MGGGMIKPPRMSAAVPMNNLGGETNVNAVYINRNLDLVMKPESEEEEGSSSLEELRQVAQESHMSQVSQDPKGDASSPSVSPASSASSHRSSEAESCHHMHSQSGISAQQLLPSKVQEDEYVV